jgi:pilus assembly protein Flp/PilA
MFRSICRDTIPAYSSFSCRAAQTGSHWRSLEIRTSDRQSLLIEDSGQDLIEYALIAALIAIAAIAAMRGLTNKINNEFNAIGNSL